MHCQPSAKLTDASAAHRLRFSTASVTPVEDGVIEAPTASASLVPRPSACVCAPRREVNACRTHAAAGRCTAFTLARPNASGPAQSSMPKTAAATARPPSCLSICRSIPKPASMTCVHEVSGAGAIRAAAGVPARRSSVRVARARVIAVQRARGAARAPKDRARTGRTAAAPAAQAQCPQAAGPTRRQPRFHLPDEHDILRQCAAFMTRLRGAECRLCSAAQERGQIQTTATRRRRATAKPLRCVLRAAAAPAARAQSGRTPAPRTT
jgi:hypothetical protein